MLLYIIIIYIQYTRVYIYIYIDLYAHVHTYADTGRISFRRASSAILATFEDSVFALQTRSVFKTFREQRRSVWLAAWSPAIWCLDNPGVMKLMLESKIDGKTYQTIYGLTGFARVNHVAATSFLCWARKGFSQHLLPNFGKFFHILRNVSRKAAVLPNEFCGETSGFIGEQTWRFRGKRLSLLFKVVLMLTSRAVRCHIYVVGLLLVWKNTQVPQKRPGDLMVERAQSWEDNDMTKRISYIYIYTYRYIYSCIYIYIHTLTSLYEMELKLKMATHPTLNSCLAEFWKLEFVPSLQFWEVQAISPILWRRRCNLLMVIFWIVPWICTNSAGRVKFSAWPPILLLRGCVRHCSFDDLAPQDVSGESPLRAFATWYAGGQAQYTQKFTYPCSYCCNTGPPAYTVWVIKREVPSARAWLFLLRAGDICSDIVWFWYNGLPSIRCRRTDIQIWSMILFCILE